MVNFLAVFAYQLAYAVHFSGAMNRLLELSCLILFYVSPLAHAQLYYEDGTEAEICESCTLEGEEIEVPQAPQLGVIADTIGCPSRDSEICAMFSELNQIRRSHGLNPLSYDSKCQAAAETHGRDMAFHHFFSHTGSDGSDISQRYARQGGSFLSLRENIYMGSGGPGRARDANASFMNSPGHRANILASDITHTGLARVQNGSETYFVQCFSRPYN